MEESSLSTIIIINGQVSFTEKYYTCRCGSSHVGGVRYMTCGRCGSSVQVPAWCLGFKCHSWSLPNF